MNIIGLEKETFVDGEGIRYSIYVSGCERHCKNCHNPESWDFNAGVKLTSDKIKEISNEFKENPLLDGFTILGGEPMHPNNRKSILDMLHSLRLVTNNIWLYTGYTLDELIRENENDDIISSILYNVDVLVDGPFIESKKTDNEPFIGSSNQRLIRTRNMISDDRFKKVYINAYTVK